MNSYPMPHSMREIGIVVKDIRRAMDELKLMLGVRWAEPRVSNQVWPGHTSVFSLDGPVHIELIQGVPGSPWDPGTGPRLDHITYWTEDVEAEKRRLAGVPGIRLGVHNVAGIPFAVFEGTASGSKIEFMQESIRQEWQERWGIR